jgi:hypothetical protein
VTVRWATPSARSSSWPGDELVDDVPAGLVDAGVGLVEQPQLGPSSDEAGERRPAPLPGRQAGDGDAGEAAVEPESGHGGIRVGRAGAGRLRPEPHVVGDGEVVVQARRVAEEPDAASNRAAIRGVGEVVAEHDRLARHDRQQPGAGS